MTGTGPRGKQEEEKAADPQGKLVASQFLLFLSSLDSSRLFKHQQSSLVENRVKLENSLESRQREARQVRWNWLIKVITKHHMSL